MSKCLNQMDLKEVIENCIKADFNNFSENYDHEKEDNPVPYGDTWVSSGEYITDKSMKRCVQEYKDKFDIDYASEFVVEVFAEDIDFLTKVVELVKEKTF